MRTLKKRDMEDLLIGAQILGCGGGGEIEWARPMIEEVYARDKQFRIIDPTEMPDDELVMIVGSVGGGVPREIIERVAKLPRIPEKPEFVAERALAKYLGREPYAFLASEIGAGNTVVPMYVAAMMDRFAVDADCCGRAKPEIAISTTHVKGVPVTPLAIVSPFGDVMILKEALDDYRAEEICRYMAVVSGGRCGVARCPASGRLIREAVIPNSITKCIKIGQKIRKAKKEGRDTVTALIQATQGFKIFEGEVKAFEREERGAFMWGTIIIDGTEGYQGHTLKIWYKNEHLISWKDEKSYVTCPDLICIVDAKTARGLSNWANDFLTGREVVAIGVKAAEIWRTERGLEIFGPKHFGYDIEYVPVEKLVNE